MPYLWLDFCCIILLALPLLFCIILFCIILFLYHSFLSFCFFLFFEYIYLLIAHVDLVYISVENCRRILFNIILFDLRICCLSNYLVSLCVFLCCDVFLCLEIVFFFLIKSLIYYNLGNVIAVKKSLYFEKGFCTPFF